MTRPEYLPSLDGIRALAAIFILFGHWDYPYWGLKQGWIGVSLFFVLSGFLITRILLKSKSETFSKYILTFIKNRALRIFPLYFFYVIVFGLILMLLTSSLPHNSEIVVNGANSFKHSWNYLITYTYNFQSLVNALHHTSSYHSTFYGHLWSLSVEEQFYLFFPVLVYYCSNQTLNKILLGFVVLGPLIRYLMGELLLNQNVHPVTTGYIIYFNTFTQFDALALGGYLATLKDEKISSIKFKFWTCITITLGIGIITLVCLKLNGGTIPTKTLGFDNPGYWFKQQDTGNTFLNYRYTYLYSLVNLCALFFISFAIQNARLGRFLSTSFLREIGKISYGIYVFHLFISALVGLLIDNLKQEFGLRMHFGSETVFFMLYLSLTYMLAKISYKYLESHFLKIKARINHV